MSEELRSGRLCVGTKKWWLLPGSNQRPVDYDSIALPTELSSQPKLSKKMAPAAGLEPATGWLTATYSTD